MLQDQASVCGGGFNPTLLEFKRTGQLAGAQWTVMHGSVKHVWRRSGSSDTLLDQRYIQQALDCKP